MTLKDQGKQQRFTKTPMHRPMSGRYFLCDEIEVVARNFRYQALTLIDHDECNRDLSAFDGCDAPFSC